MLNILFAIFVSCCAALPMNALSASEAPAPAASPEAAVPITKGSQAPTGTLLAADGSSVDLATLWAAGPTVVVVYRGSWCPFCNTHLGKLVAIRDQLTAAGVQLVVLSPDQPSINSEKDDGLRRLSDPEAITIRQLGLGFTVDDATITKYQGYGIDLEKASGQTHHILPVPAVLVIDAAGVVQFVHADPNYKERLDPAAILTAAGVAP
jgi:peroxiredoxin